MVTCHLIHVCVYHLGILFHLHKAAKKINIDIPTLCFLKDINEVGDCRMCVVEVEGKRGFATACIQKVEEGMVIKTNTPAVIEARKVVLDLILSNHDREPVGQLWIHCPQNVQFTSFKLLSPYVDTVDENPLSVQSIAQHFQW